MRVLLFGATGMIGRGVLRECLLDPDVPDVVSIVRHPGGQKHPKLHEIVHEDFLDFSRLEPELTGLDACLFCLGVSSAGMSENDYRRVTYDITLAAAQTLARLNPGMIFIYVSGAGTDSTEQGRSMWARVKGMTENALLRVPFKAVYLFRPAGIQPLHGITSRTRLYHVFYAAARPLFPLLRAILPNLMTTTEQLGRAMLTVAKHGFPTPVIESRDINHI
ncbi:MAG TPA: hypothetical protein PLS53_10790 [Thermoanaerobaculaceae bacterium]|nr:hypothetical protein [Thermoanaerobaculaceae bacterium]